MTGSEAHSHDPEVDHSRGLSTNSHLLPPNPCTMDIAEKLKEQERRVEILRQFQELREVDTYDPRCDVAKWKDDDGLIMRTIYLPAHPLRRHGLCLLCSHARSACRNLAPHREQLGSQLRT